ncbi:MAG: XRE family transcriptional regulator [Planctomycetales bacterium 71-10]|nr:MAG: XRE family transcriptional regulator [Planctomycetales bacterium 71-10]
MSDAPLHCSLRAMRTTRGWSQEDVARRAGISRAGVGAIEAGRLVPSTAAALALAAAFGCRVEDLFRLDGAAGPGEVEWAWPPDRLPARYWLAESAGRVRAYPTEPTPRGGPAHDGVARAGSPRLIDGAEPGRTLVVASCDPAAALLADAYERATGFRMLVLPRSSGRATELLAAGLVHAAGLHLAGDDEPDANAEAVRGRIGGGSRLLRLARWEEGLALAPGVAARTVAAALRADLAWVGREPGSSARVCLDRLRPRRPGPRITARDHRGVAEAVRNGWAEAGVCLRLACEEAGLAFLGVRTDHYDLAFRERDAEDPRIRGLVRVARSASLRDLLADLPGYRPDDAGEVRPVPDES